MPRVVTWRAGAELQATRVRLHQRASPGSSEGLLQGQGRPRGSRRAEEAAQGSRPLEGRAREQLGLPRPVRARRDRRRVPGAGLVRARHHGRHPRARREAPRRRRGRRAAAAPRSAAPPGPAHVPEGGAEVIVRALAIVGLVAGAAAADPAADSRAEEQASEANLVSNAPRAGVTFSAALGGGLIMGDGVGRGPAASFRLGHVATSKTVLTFEIAAGSLLHEPMAGDLRHNDLAHLMAGALYYAGPSVWIRGAGGLTLYTVSDPGQSNKPHSGVGGLGGVGIDLVRWHYLVLGIESFATLSIVSTRGLMLGSGLCLGL